MTDAPHSGGRLRNEISAAIVRLLADHFGRGAMQARTHVTGDVVVCVLGEVLTPAERTLVASGQEDAVRQMRDRFQQVMRDRFVQEIEAISGRRVRSALGDLDVTADVAVQIFLLDAPAEPG